MEGFELDELKSAWKNQKVSKDYTAQDIFLMLKRKSVTSVKWIFYISLFELMLGIICLVVFAFTTSFTGFHEGLKSDLGNWAFLYEFIYVAVYILSLVFIYLFFKAYRKIRVESSVSALSQQILNFRKTVNWYIILNLILFVVMIPLAVMQSMNRLNAQGVEITGSTLIGAIVGIVVTLLFFLAFVLVYYYLIYGTFLRRLKKNQNELQKIEA